MSTTANINLSSQALTARLKRAGLRCEAGSMYEGGFSCRQYRDRAGFYYYSPVDYQGGLPYAELEEEIANYHINTCGFKA